MLYARVVLDGETLQISPSIGTVLNILRIKNRCISDSHPLIQLEVRHFSPSEKKLASARALSSFMVRKIRCQTHLSQGAHAPPTPTPTRPSPPHPADWACSHRHRHDLVFMSGPSAAQSSYGFKAHRCLLNHNTNCPGSGWNKRFLFFFFLVFSR